MCSLPRKHHYVPVCYLNQFTNSQKSFYKKRNDNGKISLTNPSKVCYELDTNRFRYSETMESNNIDDEYYVEKNSFKIQENNYGKIAGAITKFQIEPKVIDKDKYYLFLETLITIKRRNPTSRNEIIQAFKEGYNSEEGKKKLKELLLEDIASGKVDPSIEQYLIDSLINRSKDDDYLHDMYLSAYVDKTEHTTIPNVARDLYVLKQVIFHPPIGYQFITSDNPGFLIVGDKVINLGGFGGDFQFYFPLSPTSCLFIRSNDREDGRITEKTIYHLPASDFVVNTINNATKTVSNKSLFSLSRAVLERMP